jgi:hypothetical protein
VESTRGRERDVTGNEQYWFCLNHHRVEGPEGCAYKDRLGPYATSEEATHALEKVEQRNREWDEDPRWNDK